MPRKVTEKATRWIDVFESFIQSLRIDSKEETAQDDRGTPLDLWGSQKRFLSELAAGLELGVRIFVCLKSRQLGITTIALAICIFWLAMHPGIKGALVVDSEENREDFRRTLRRYIQSFPEGYFGDEFKLKKGGDNRYGMEFTNGSRLVIIVAGKTKAKQNWGEGKGFAFALLSECSKYGNGEGIKNFEEALAQKNPDRLVIYESTANGPNFWKDRCIEAMNDEHAQRFFFIGWWSNPNNLIDKSDLRFTKYGAAEPTEEEAELIQAVADEYDHAVTREQLAWYRWREEQAAQSGIGVLDQNQPWLWKQAFIITGSSFFSTQKVSHDMARIGTGGQDEQTFNGYRFDVDKEFYSLQMIRITDPREASKIQFRVWEPPVLGGKYCIGCDPSYGRNEHKDAHAIGVFRCFADKIVQVAEFATADILTKHCAWILAFIAGAYDDCVVNLELGGPGRLIMLEWDHVLAVLKSEVYAENFKQWAWDDALSNARWYLYHRPDQMGSGYAYNFEATWRTQQELMHGYRGSYMTDELVIRSVKLLEEMTHVVQDGAHIGAPESKNEDGKDDRVFAASMAVRAWVNWVRPSMLAMGQTYEVVMKEESGDRPSPSRRINNQVYNFFRRREEEASMDVDPRERWKVERGLA